MTEPSIYYPEHLTGRLLDTFLSKGWYRMFQSIFTTHYITEKDRMYRVFWMRYNLFQICFGKKQQKIFSSNRRFTTVIKPAVVTDELEELYTLYKTGITFDPSHSVHHWLYGEQSGNVFETEIIEIKDKGKLIAAGIFDNGENSIAGIMNFYHPDYKRYSLGKYLMLLKIEHAKAMNKQWYYPGYIIHGYSRFDYKLFVDKEAAEIYIPELNRWHKYHPSLPGAIEEANMRGDQEIIL